MANIGGYLRLTLLDSTPEREHVMIIWQPGSRTPIHDHGKSTGRVKVHVGRPFEQSFSPESRKKLGGLVYHDTGTEISEEGSSTHYMGSEEFAVTEHIYEPAIHMRVFRDEEFET